MLAKLKTFYIECKRVLKLTKKPDNTEFKAIVKVSGLGILIIGALGFLLLVVKEMLI